MRRSSAIRVLRSGFPRLTSLDVLLVGLLVSDAGIDRNGTADMSTSSRKRMPSPLSD